MQILVPISGSSQFFPEDEYYFPKPLLDIGGHPMIQHSVEALNKHCADIRFCFVAAEDLCRRFSLDQTLKLLGGEGTKVVRRMGKTGGGLCSALLAIGEINPQAPLLISNSDQVIDAPLADIFNRFVERQLDVGVVTFRSVHPRWSYVISDQDGHFVQAVEKKVASDKAIAGLYYFKTAGSFFEAAQRAILADDQVDGQFYFSSAINQIILMGGVAGYEQIDEQNYFSFYAPDKVSEYTVEHQSRSSSSKTADDVKINVVIPAAGEGSRFAKSGWKRPKPFIHVDGRMMLELVIDNVACGKLNWDTTLMLRKSHMDNFEKEVAAVQERVKTIKPIAELTEGTACTVLLARAIFDCDDGLLIANSDQLVAFDCEAFVKDCLDRGLDGSILVFRDPEKNPKWSFAKVSSMGLVEEVAEKKPISDLATVGIYFFRKGSDFVRAAVDMIAQNDRVNGEFYTCPVYNYLIRNGGHVGVYEVPADAMKGLGTPEDLTKYLAETGAPPSPDRPEDNDHLSGAAG